MSKPTFKEAFLFWLKLGFISFGGPAGQIAIMHEYLVGQKKWISDSKFLHALNYCMLLPGPEAQQLATYTGWLLHGIRGGLVAGILFILPSMFVLLGLSSIYVIYGDIPWIYAMFVGLKPAVIAIILLALIKISQKSLLNPFHYFVAVASFIGIFFFNISFPIIILSAIIIATVLRRFVPSFFKAGSNNGNQEGNDETKYYINKYSVINGAGFNLSKLAAKTGVFILLLLIPVIGFYLFTSDFKFWLNLSAFFTKAALVTFGGAYAILPYVAQVSVEKFGWLSNLQMIDGLALGETTPGPLIMVLVFVGYMAGYNHFGNSIAMGSLGLVTTTFYTFLPSLFFILAGAPIIEMTQENKKIKEILSIVTAAVVGVILNLTIYLGKAVIFPTNISLQNTDYIMLGWTIISVIAMHRFKVNMIVLIGISAVFGLAYHLLKVNF